MAALKDYQEKALQALETFFHQFRISDLRTAWRSCAPPSGKSRQHGQAEYKDAAMGDIPALCIRIPTGGGKTLLAAHAVALAGKGLKDSQAPLALWLVPSEAIRRQTLLALSEPHNLCHEAMKEHFGDDVRICSLEELPLVPPQEAGRCALVVVATIQSFNVRNKAIRNVYAFDESFERHFQALEPPRAAPLDRVSEDDLAAQPYLTAADLGRIKVSLANWLTLHHPIIIVDEAHNNRTEQAFRTLRDLHPACIIEFTATPMPDSNVLFHVGAQALAREDMIKLPIVLMEHKTGWKEAVRDAVLLREHLETLALKEADYIRPVLLFQAEPANGEVTVPVLLDHLLSKEGENLPRRQIAVATGTQKELDGIALAHPDCAIRFVVTVEALKEGWDCPFAYVLCSLQDMRSAKDVEQLLGRVLRMPYAKPRRQPELGKAYAHVVSTVTARVADTLTERLINNMGFERYEALQAIAPVQQDFLPRGEEQGRPVLAPEALISLPSTPSDSVPYHLREFIEIRPTSSGATALIRGWLSDAIEGYLLDSCRPGKQREALRESILRERQRQDANLAPASRNIPFAPLPQLCLHWEDDVHPAEPGVLAAMGGFDLLGAPVGLEGFSIRESGLVFEIDLNGDRVVYSRTDSAQLHLDEVPSHVGEQDLVRWLDHECRQADIPQSILLKWLLMLIQHLTADRGFTLTALVRSKFLLAEAIRGEIGRRRRAAVKAGFQAALPGLTASPRLDGGFTFAFVFRPNGYPARPPFYSGRYRFRKHYYPLIHDLREKRADGRPTEEFLCAQAIDMNSSVRHWVRNVEREERFSFWLPLAEERFYPDFVAELHDGRVLVIEYKGGHLLGTAETREKAQVGFQWESTAGGKALFLLAVAEEEDPHGRSPMSQIEDKIAGKS